MIFMMQFIKVSVCLLSLQSDWHFTIFLLFAAAVSLVVDDIGRPKQQDQCQAHEADATQHYDQ